MTGAIGHGLTGVAAGFERFERAAAAIARDGASDGLAGQAVELMRSRQEVRASLAVVRAADELTGTILDVFA